VFSDLTLYADALELAGEREGITATRLQRELRPRLHALRFIEEQSRSVARKLVEELQLFGWVDAPGPGHPARMTSSGREALAKAQSDRRGFLRSLAERMHEVYVVPGWFVNRLWTVNSKDGEVILPAPSPRWSPSQMTKEARAWTPELQEQTLQAAERARTANPLAFPVDDASWQEAVRRTWERIRNRKTRKAVNGRDPVTGTRSGLTLAMRWASLNLLFGPAPFSPDEPAFRAERSLSVKTFKPWCPRLQALELIGYTDWHPHVAPGRLLFPAALFRSGGATEQFEELAGIRHPDGRLLFLHQPAWPQWRESFWRILVAVYEETFRRVQARYVSLPDVRDEVCRRLRLSPARFDGFLEHAFAEAPEESGWHLSLETDTREELRTSRGLARRPVYVQDVPHTLIALARLTRVPRSVS
jgi:hypothetical protein